MKKITLTLIKALVRQAQLVDLCKTQGKKFTKTPTQANWNKLEEYEEELARLTDSLLTANATLRNNPRIKQRELLVRRLDVLKKTDEEIEKRKTKFSFANFKKWFQQKDVDTNELREGILLKIQTITEELTKFNEEHTITY